MKKILISLIALFATVSMVAQEHLSFKGIPIEGSMTEFCKKLRTKGFEVTEQGNSLTLLSGDFTGREVTVGVNATDDGEIVYSVGVLFNPSTEWKILVNTYNYYKDLYTRKYGKPTISIEENPAHSDSNMDLMREVEKGSVVYSSVWVVKGGDIELSIEKYYKPFEGIVMIKYRDFQNAEEKIKKDMDDI